MGHGVTAHAQSNPDKPALVLDDGTKESYGELDARTSGLAHAMGDWGVEAEPTVAAMLPNGLEFVETAIAAAKLRARFLPVNYHLTHSEVDWIVRDSEARLLVVDASIADSLQIHSTRILTTGDAYDAAAAHAALTPMDSGPSWQPVFYTSGTTGRPKGVMHNFGGPELAAAGMQAQVALWRWQPDDVHLVCGPAYHAGPGGWTMTALYVGATSVI